MHNTMQLSLKEALRQHPVGEKLLIVQNQQAGYALLRSLVLSGISCANLRVSTPYALALSVVWPRLLQLGIRPVGEVGLLLLVEELLTHIPAGTPLSAYLGQAMVTPGLGAAFRRSLRDLRLGGITSENLSPSRFETATKGEALCQLLGAYERLLAERQLVDEAEIFRMALAANLDARPGRIYLLADHRPIFDGLVERFLHELTKGTLLRLSSDEIVKPETAPLLTLFHATSIHHEARSVLRRMLTHEKAFDQVEVVVTDWQTYAPVIRHLFVDVGVAATYARGLPLVETVAGRAVLAFATWLQDGFHATTLAQALGEGVLVVPGALPDQGGYLGRLLKESPIGWGRERYLPQLVVLEQKSSDSLRRGHASRSEADADPGNREAAARKLEGVRVLKAWIEDLFRLIPTEGLGGSVALADVCRASRHLLERFVPDSAPDGFDATARKELIDMLADVEQYPAVYPLAEAGRRLQLLINERSVGAAAAAPGHVHVTDLDGAGWHGRSVMYILGLDADRFPGTGLQDPVLTDDERSAISPQLELASTRLQHRQARLLSVLAGVRGHVTCSYSVSDPATSRSGFPSTTLLTLYQECMGQPDADYSTLMKAFGPVEGYVPAPATLPLGVQDWWFSRISSTAGRPFDVRRAVLAAYPHLCQGVEAENHRDGLELTRFDGWVGPDAALDPRQNPAMEISSSRLESLATCPRRYFYQHVLRVVKSEEFSYDPTRWLDPSQRGTLLHDIFYAFMVGLRATAEGRPNMSHLNRLRGLATEKIEAYRDRVPPPNEAVYAAERDDLLDTMEIFLRMESAAERTGQPRFFELGFGLREEGAGDQGSREAITLYTASGQTIRLCGRIDRVDHLGDNRYAIWDYKTGSNRHFEDEGYFDGGKQIQHALYAIAAEGLLREMTANPSAEVVEAGYLFPTSKGEGRQVSRRQDRRADVTQLLDDLAELMRQGLFVARAKPNDCQWCEYAEACGAQRTVEQTKTKESQTPALAAVKKVADYE